MNYKIIEMDSFNVVGVNEQISTVNQEHATKVPEFWKKVSTDSTIENLLALNHGEPSGILGLCSAIDESSFLYWIAVSTSDTSPENYGSMSIPASMWAVFEVIGAMPDAMQNAWNRIYNEWFPESGFLHANAPEIERYLEGNSMDENYISEIWIPIIKKI